MKVLETKFEISVRVRVTVLLTTEQFHHHDTPFHFLKYVFAFITLWVCFYICAHMFLVPVAERRVYSLLNPLELTRWLLDPI